MTMSAFLTLVAAAWASAILLLALCMLNGSGALLRLHNRLGPWLRQLAPQI